MPGRKSYLETGKHYHSLSLKDLLEARDAYHVYLTRKKNVIGTAIGKYRSRKARQPETGPKTLENTEIKRYAWPCVMVFVKEWLTKKDFARKFDELGDEYVQRTLYLPDGREIPVCVIQAIWPPKSPDSIVKMKFPGSVIGGGYPIMTEVQGEERWATLGCLVSDGRITYGLTNAHVTGLPGENLYTMKNGNIVPIGVSTDKQIRKVPFSRIYEDYGGKHVLVNLDIGLVKLNDINGVTSQVFGLGNVRGIEDVNHDTLSLNLIGCPVKGFGCMSGRMEGEIAGLFYRYTTSGGYDYVADYLVIPRAAGPDRPAPPFSPGRGDSGTLLVIDDPGADENMKAIGVLWGGETDVSGGSPQPWGLVTNLGTICQQLDIELVSDWNTGYDVYFGSYAHIVLPSLCAGILRDKDLKKLMEDNVANFSMSLETTAIKKTKGLSKPTVDFVPLSDVPDLVWKKRGGKYNRSHEGPNHFADMDQPNAKRNQQTLLDYCGDDKANISPDKWVEFYKEVKANQKGALPFRIAQVYDAMVVAAKEGETARFVGAAGILTHYVFDACQPLHISYMHHGDPNGPKKEVREKEVSKANDVHDEFDNQLVEYFSAELKERLPQMVSEKASKEEQDIINRIKIPRDVAVEAVELMRKVVGNTSPTEIAKYYEELVDKTKRERCSLLWEKYGDKLLKSIAEGVVFVAALWEAAWLRGNANQNMETGFVPEAELKRLYQTTEGFLNSVKLEDITREMDWKVV